MSVRNKLEKGSPILESPKVPYSTESLGRRLGDDNELTISKRFSEAGATKETLDKCNEDELNRDLATLPKKKQSDHRPAAYSNSKVGGERKVLSWRNKKGKNGRNGNRLTFGLNQAHSRRHHFRRWLNEKTGETKEHRFLPKASRAAAHIETTQPIDTSKKNIEASGKDFLKSESNNADFLESNEYLNDQMNDKQRFERSQSNLVQEDSQDNEELEIVHDVMKETKNQINKNYDDYDDNSQVITYPRKLSSNHVTSIKHHSQRSCNSNGANNSPFLGSLGKGFLPIDVKSESSPHTQLASPGKNDEDDPNFDIQKNWICHLDETNGPMVSMDEGSEFVLFSSAESALDNNTEDSIREGDPSVSLLDAVYSDDDSKETVWNQVACDRRQRLLLQMESLAPRSFQLASLISDW